MNYCKYMLLAYERNIIFIWEGGRWVEVGSVMEEMNDIGGRRGFIVRRGRDGVGGLIVWYCKMEWSWVMGYKHSR